LGWLIKKTLRFGDAETPFCYRVGSEGDRGAVAQVFYGQGYRVDRWHHGRALEKFAASKSSESSLLILDAGANIGAASIYFSTQYPGSRVVAIEPEKNNAALARLNCKNRDIEIVEGAIGREEGRMFLQDPGLSDWGFRVGNEGNYEVQVFTIDQLLTNHGKGSIPFILKIDIEGGEADLFAGDCDWLDRFALTVVELHDWMLPGDRCSQSFMHQLSRRDFDIIQHGENIFCFNNQLLGAHY
jgi:FkbM family methyltransferase